MGLDKLSTAILLSMLIIREVANYLKSLTVKYIIVLIYMIVIAYTLYKNHTHVHKSNKSTSTL